jgi:D-glycero-D-manno-heptose 1,7-bisphosphate phosphatase
MAQHLLDGVGLWADIRCARPAPAGPVLFLDRDGVLIEDRGYVGSAADTRVYPDAAEAVAAARRLGYRVAIVTNQSGIARGLYDWSGFAAVQAAIARALAEAGARLDAVFACAHHADGKPPLNIANHPWRKPNPGMIVAAAERLQLDLARSWIAGNRASDLAAGKAAGLAGGVLISSRADDAERASALQLRNGDFAVDVALSLADAVAFLLARDRLALTSSSQT